MVAGRATVAVPSRTTATCRSANTARWVFDRAYERLGVGYASTVGEHDPLDTLVEKSEDARRIDVRYSRQCTATYRLRRADEAAAHFGADATVFAVDDN